MGLIGYTVHTFALPRPETTVTPTKPRVNNSHPSKPIVQNLVSSTKSGCTKGFVGVNTFEHEFTNNASLNSPVISEMLLISRKWKDCQISIKMTQFFFFCQL